METLALSTVAETLLLNIVTETLSFHTITTTLLHINLSFISYSNNHFIAH